MTKKFSQYNHMFAQGNRFVLYNVASDGILLLESDAAKVIQENKEQIDKLKDIHPTLFNALVEHEMLVDADVDEAELLLKRWHEVDDNPESFTLLLLPTLDCNLRCWYCYEKHVKGSVMTAETQRRICRLIDRLLEKPELKQLNFCFFGGEPLLTFKSVDLPLLQYARKVTKEKGVRLTAQFTTNGVLLTDKVRQALVDLELDAPPSFQITIDGNREKHNESRCTSSHAPTFDVIIKNIKDTARAGMPVMNRFNYSRQNVESFIDNLKLYEDFTLEEMEFVQFDFQQVWQDEMNAEVRKKATAIASEFAKRGLKVSIDKHFNKERCPEDSLRQIGINYDGLIYKCTARNIKPELCDGILNEDGTITWTERYHERMSHRFGTDACKLCSIFPICNGGCTQANLESDGAACYKHFSEAQKQEVIIGRLTYLLQKSNQ